jgi:tetratricopeptide (TPR) repeat protein
MRTSILIGLALALGMPPGVAPAPGAPGPPDAAPPTPATGPRDCTPQPVEVAPSADPLGDALRYYARGRTHMDEGENALAAGELRKASLLAPNVLCIRQFLGAALYETGNLRDADDALDQALRLDPADAFTLYLRGRVARSLNRPDQAADFFDRSLHAAPPASPHHILSRYYLARTRQEAGDLDAAIEHYAALLAEIEEPRAIFRRYPEIYLLYQGRPQLEQLIGRLYLLRGDNDLAIALFEKALADRPNNTELLGLLCRAFLQKQDFAGARALARRLIETHPDGADGYQRLIETYRAEGKIEAAVAELEAFRRTSPENRTLAFELAAAYEEAGRKDQAAALYGELSAGAASADGAAVPAAMKLAELRLGEGRPLEALQALAAAMTRLAAMRAGRRNESALLVRGAQIIDALDDPDAVYQEAKGFLHGEAEPFGTFVLLGMLAERLKKTDDAIGLYTQAIAREPRAAIAYSRKADLLIQQNRLDDALAVYRDALQAGLALPIFYRKMGMILDSLGRPEDAVEQYRRARQGDPDDKPTRYFLAAALARLGRLDEAEAEFRALIERFPTEVRAYCQLAAVALAQGDAAKAETAVNQALAIDPKHPTPRTLLAEVRYRQKRFTDAESLARTLLAEQPDAHDVRLLLAHALAAQGRFPDAAAEVRAMLAAEPENLDWRYLLAGLYSEMADPDAAEKELAKILQVRPDHPPANNDLGYLWANRGINLDRAEKMIRLALQSDPKSPAYMDSLGWVFYKRGSFEDALKILQAAADLSAEAQPVRQSPQVANTTGDSTRRGDGGRAKADAAPELDPVIWDHLGDAYWRLSRSEDAADAWQKAAKILEGRSERPRPDDLERVREKMNTLRAGAAPPVAPTADADQLENDHPDHEPAPTEP